MNTRDFLSAARRMFDKGLTTHPLINDAQGYPKRPFVQGWQTLPHDWPTIEALPWDHALGIGIVLGATSGNLAVLDIDDVDLAVTIRAMLKGPRAPLFVQTIRKRGHLYVREQQPSHSTYRVVKWDGRDVKIELKATGTQVAAPPTPGYSFSVKGEPFETTSVLAVYDFLASVLTERHPGRFEAPKKSESTSDYPRPWGTTVEKGDRNKAVYIEAHRLREARMPLEQATELLLLRAQQHYQQGDMNARELVTTIKSAYRVGVPSEGVTNGQFDAFALYR